MAQEIRLPRLVGSREAARAYVAELDMPFAGSPVVVNCRDLRAASASFADELVQAVLVEGRASQLVVRGAGDSFSGQLRSAALAHAVLGRLVVQQPGTQGQALRRVPLRPPPPRRGR